MNQFLAIIFVLLYSSSGIHTSEDPYDITDLLQTTYGQLLRTIDGKFVKKSHNQTPLDSYRTPMEYKIKPLRLRLYNVSVNLTPQPFQLNSIRCEFFDNFMMIYDGVYATSNGSIRLESVPGRPTIDFNASIDRIISTIKYTSTGAEISETHNTPEISLSSTSYQYKDNEEYEILKKIEIALISMIKETMLHYAQPILSPLSDLCMHPNSDLIASHPDYLDQKHYYQLLSTPTPIKNCEVDIQSVALVRGLWNYKSLNVKYTEDGAEFDLLVDNVQGRMNKGFASVNETEFDFNFGNITITGNADNADVKVKVDGCQILKASSNESLPEVDSQSIVEKYETAMGASIILAIEDTSKNTHLPPITWPESTLETLQSSTYQISSIYTKSIAKLLRSFDDYAFTKIYKGSSINFPVEIFTAEEMKRNVTLLLFKHNLYLSDVEIHYKVSGAQHQSCQFANNFEVSLNNVEIKPQGKANIQGNIIESFEIGIPFTANITRMKITRNKNDTQFQIHTERNTTFITLKKTWGGYLIRNKQELSEKIIDMLMDTISQQITENPNRWFPSIYQQCMNPKKLLIEARPNFLEQENQYYYLITKPPVDTSKCPFLQINYIKLEGLSNLKALKMEKYYDTNIFELVAENITAHMNWNYLSGVNVSKEERQTDFQVETITLIGIIDRINSQMNFPNAEIVAKVKTPSADTEDIMITEKFKSIVLFSMKQSIKEEYNKMN